MSNFPELDNWNPMEEDYKNPRFNSYNDMADPILYDLTTLYVKNIPIDLTDDTFLSLMTENGRKVKRQRLFPPKNDYQTKIGLVSFTTEAEAQDAMNSLNKKPPHRFQVQYALNKAKEIKNNPTYETTKNSNANMTTNEAFQPTKKFSFGRGVGLNNELVSHSNLKVVVEGEKRTAYRKSPEKPNKLEAESKPVPQLLSYPFPLCLHCKKQALNMCGICQQFYCSRECQEKDWPKHQAVCQPANRLSKNNSLPKSVPNVGTDSSYMSESSDAERSESGDVSQKNVSHKNRVNSPRANSKDSSSSGKKTSDFKEASLSRDSSKFQKVEVVTKIDDLKETTFPREGKVRVSSINSPSCFYVQLEEAKDVICEMEKSMSSANLRKADCSVNDICCVNHEAKYRRVQIMKVMPSSSLVSFIDSGGFHTFPLNQVFQLPEGLKKYPTQAMCCNLVDSSTDKNVQWSEEQTSAFKSFALDKVFNIHAHGCSGKVHDVSLFNNEGVSVFTVISLLHLQEPDQESANKCSDIPTVWTDLKNSMEFKILPFELQDDRFYGMVLSDESALTVQAIEAELQTIMPNKENISFRSKEGDVAVGSSDQYGFFRCLVLKKMKSSFKVRSIDYGNQDEITVLHDLPSNLQQKKSFVVCCEKPNPMSPEKFKKLFPVQNPIDGSVKSINNSYKELEFKCDSEVVVLKCFPWYHGALEKISISPEIRNKSPPLLALPKKVMKGAIADRRVSPDDKYNVKVVYFKTSSELFVQLEKDEAEIIRLSQNLHKFCNLPSNNMDRYDPVIDELVACKFSEDGNWYRGQVLKKSGNSFRVFFIDYGNESDVSDVDIKPLSEELLHSKLCLSVCLHGVKNEELNRDLLTKLCSEVWVMEVKACSKDSVQVMLFQGQKSLIDFLKKKNLYSSLAFQKLPAKDPVDIQITHADSDYIYVQMQKDLKQIESLTEKLNSIEKKAVSSKALVNHIYCGLFSDGLWYRISIEKELDSSKFMVNFIDFGNKEELFVKDLRELPEELLTYPVFCIRVAAQNFDTSTLQLQKTYSVMVIGEKNGVQEVKFCTAEGTNRLPKVSTLKKQTLGVGEEVELSLCYLEGDIYYSQIKSAQKLRESLESDLLKASDFGVIASLPEIGDLLCARCSDGVWYRGSVVEISSADFCKICFIDFGNTEIVSLKDMKVLPSSLCSFPIFSIPLKVKNVDVLEEQLAVDNLFSVKVLEVKENVYAVEVLKPKEACKTDIKPQVLPSTPVDVVVCFKEKERYYVQKYCDLEKLSKMTTDFLTSNLQAISGAPEVGNIFCVKYQDGVLYRGLVKAVLGKERYNIYFIDYGNTDIMNKSDMFVLPSAYSSQPMFCIPIQLDKASLSNPLEMDTQYSVKYSGKMNGDSHIISISSPVSPFLLNSLKEPLLENSAEVSFLSFDNEYHYVRKTSDIEEYKRMENLLDGLSCDKIVHIPSVNEVFLVKCDDKKLQRGCIRGSNEALGQHIVNVIDLGTTANVSACDLFYVPPKVRTFPNFTIKVKVSSDSPSGTVGNKYNVNVIKKTDAGVPVISMIKPFLFKDLEHQCLPEGEPRKVIFYHKECDTLYLQDNSNREQLIEILTEVNKSAANSALSHIPVEGELLSARSAADDIWYRASVTKAVSSDKFRVLFIDYGNSEVVSKESLQPFSEKLMSYPSQAIAVKVVQPLNLDVILETEYEVMALSRPIDGVQNVKIQLENSSKLAGPPSTSENSRSNKFYFRNYKYIPFPSGEQEIVIYHFDGVNQFYGAPFGTNVSQNFYFTGELTKYCQSLGIDKFDGDSEPEIGELVLAKYHGDWFRAVVVVKSPPYYDVTFLDYGYTQHVHINECRKMVERFMDLDFQAHKCLLSGFAVSHGKEAAVVEELKNFEDDKQTAVVKYHGENRKVYISKIIDHLVEKKLAIRQD